MKRVFAIPARTHGIGNIKFQWQSKTCNYLATSGSNRTVFVFDRKGNAVAEFVLPGKCTGMEWDKDGQHLAVTHDSSASVFLWNSSTKDVHEVNVGLKGKGTCLKWSQTGPQLVVGNNKGDLSVYSVPTERRLPLLGRHRDRIVSCDWNSDDKFIVASADKKVSINTATGDLVASADCEGDPSLVKTFDSSKHTSVEADFAVVLNKKTLLLFSYDQPNQPTELSFQSHYGSIVSYEWFSTDKLMIGFSSGYYIVMSANKESIGKEKHMSHAHRTRLTDIATSESLGKMATCGDSQVKIMDMDVFSEIFSIIELEDDSGLLDSLRWSGDGQLLSISTESGALYTYLTKLPVVGDACESSVGYLSALQELSISEDSGEMIRIKLPVEPSAVAVHEQFAACAMNNSAWFFNIAEEPPIMMPGAPRTYTSSIKKIKLAGEFAAVHCGKKVQLHLVDSAAGDEVTNAEKMFPQKSSESVAAMDLSENFLVYATSDGTIYYFSLEDWQPVNEFKHVCGIQQIFGDSTGVQLVVFDAKGDGLLYSPVDDSMLGLPEFPINAKGAVFDISPEDSTFVVYDDEYAYTYLHCPDHVDGAHVEYVSQTRLQSGHIPVRLDNGTLTSLSPAGKTTKLLLGSHKYASVASVPSAEIPSAVTANLTIGNLHSCLVLLKKLKQTDASLAAPLFARVGQAALSALDLDTALHAFRLGGDAKMVQALSNIRFVEDSHLLTGHVHLFEGNHQAAEQHFLKSSAPEQALDLHRDLLHWEEALVLAQRYSKKDIPLLSREYAVELEHQGNYSKALELYQVAVGGDVKETKNHHQLCKAGMARSAMGSGDIKRGSALAKEVNQKQLYRDCGAILEGMKQFSDAADMYERGGYYDKAADIYIQAKDWRRVGELLQHVTTPRLHALYAKSREDDGSYKEAADAYEKAHDYIAVIRINLDNLRNPDKAVEVVKKTGSLEGAKMVAEFFRRINDFASAIQFLVLSQANKEAFKMAKQHNQLSVYAQVLEENGGTVEDYRAIAASFEDVNDATEAGRFYCRAGDYDKAIDKLVTASNADNAHIDLMVDTVGEAKDEAITQRVIDYLLGSTDGVPKDTTYLLKLYLVTEQFIAACKTALTIASEERTAGSYRNAHDILLDVYLELFKRHMTIPSEIYEDLVVLHSYILGKIHLRRGDHLKAGRMLLRVAEKVDKFPSHVINILTSTVIECFRSGMRKSAFTHAAVLMKPEHKSKLDAKYAKKIETIVRKKDQSEVEEETSPCPYCSAPLKDTALRCYSCEHRLPLCSASGYFVPKASLVVCKHCGSPAREAEIASLLTTEDKCPMCCTAVTSYVAPPDVDSFFTHFSDVFKSSSAIMEEKGDEYIEVDGDDDEEEDDEDVEDF